jgi:flagellar FliL protein
MSKAGAGGGRETMTMLVVVLLLTLMGAGVGFAVGTLLARVDADPPPATAATAASDPATPGGGDQNVTDIAETDVTSENMKIIRLPPVLTTLAEPRGRWIRLEGSILARPDSKVSPEQLAEEAGGQILTYLRSVRLDQLESASSVLGLRDDLDDTVRTLSGGDVQKLLIHGLVVE